MPMTEPLTLLEKNNMRLKKIRNSVAKSIKWFPENDMEANQDKCHFLFSLDITTKLSLTDYSIQNSNSDKLAGVIIEGKLNFQEHVTI